jgi:hypothetical protein
MEFIDDDAEHGPCAPADGQARRQEEVKDVATNQKGSSDMSDRGGVTTVGLLVVILVGTAVGALVGLRY